MNVFNTGMTEPIAKDFAEAKIRCVTIAVGWIKTPYLDYIPPMTLRTILKDCMVSPNFGSPDEFAHLAQSVVVNPHINATTIQLAAGVNMTF